MSLQELGEGGRGKMCVLEDMNIPPRVVSQLEGSKQRVLKVANKETPKIGE
jgi:hypothetical protein